MRVSHPKPLYEVLDYHLPIVALKAFEAHEPLLLDSTAQTQGGRYSFMAVSPFHIIECQAGTVWFDGALHTGDFWSFLKEIVQRYPLALVPALPHFQGGLAGFFGYELATTLERLPRVAHDDLHFPDARLGCYDLVIAWDHHLKTCGVFSSGYPAGELQREARARERLKWVKAILSATKAYEASAPALTTTLESNFTALEYQDTVRQIQSLIRAGDIFQANVSQRFECAIPLNFDKVALYHHLSQINPAPFAGFYAFDDHAIVSASPERLVALQEQEVIASPIKGTIARHADPAEDAKRAQWLAQHEKDRAENIMIVDLLRNDLSRVCLPHHVEVPALCAVQAFATVHHLVSTITGKLAPQYDSVDLLKAVFPGGSITGAPKIRAMEIIAALERVVRGPYCGSLGYVGFNGYCDISILIRTFALHQSKLTFHAGGAITLDSDPESEYQETLAKAAALKKTLFETVLCL